jgi:hypothetical protein
MDRCEGLFEDRVLGDGETPGGLDDGRQTPVHHVAAEHLLEGLLIAGTGVLESVPRSPCRGPAGVGAVAPPAASRLDFILMAAVLTYADLQARLRSAGEVPNPTWSSSRGRWTLRETGQGSDAAAANRQEPAMISM